MGGKLFQGVQALGKSGLCSGQLAGDCCKSVPQSTGHLNGARLCGAMKMAKSCKEGWLQLEEDLGRKVTGLKLGASKDSSLLNISVKMYPPSCDLYTQYQFMCEMYWLTVHLLYM